MNDGLQIYVNYFLVGTKMEKIILLFFTFSGICSCFSQLPKQVTDTPVLLLNLIKNDSLLQSGRLVKERASLSLHPNPAKNKTEIVVKGFEPGHVIIQLISYSGKRLREEKRLILSGNESIFFMFSEKPGLYFLFVKQGKIIAKNKLVIQ